ncbi:MAG: sugar phosphate nucleotidyltransferase [Candidatus Moranbacteria bacterium]|nr:sugar phosphate nucleotidyltransferase [Candidatus Moranbacteria bacterium]
MFLTPKTKVWVVMSAMIGIVLLMLCTPFLISSGTGIVPREVVQAVFLTMEFFAAIFLLNEFNRLRIIIKEKESDSKILQKIEEDVHNLSYFKSATAGMKGIILAGGTATRLFPLTITTSKQLLPIYDYQMIFYPLNTLISAGIKDIFMIVSPENSGPFLNLLGSIFKEYGINIYFEVQKVPRGLADAFILAEKFIGNDSVALVLGDNIFEDNFSEAIKNFKSGGHVFAKKVSDPERSGVVKFDENNKAVQIVEKPKEWISDYAITGLYLYDSEVVKVAKSLAPSERGELEIVDLHNFYLNKEKLKVTVFDGEWLDAGTFDSLLEAGKIVKDKGISANFHPIIKDAVRKFNEEMKTRLKRNLEAYNIFLREEQNKKV